MILELLARWGWIQLVYVQGEHFSLRRIVKRDIVSRCRNKIEVPYFGEMRLLPGGRTEGWASLKWTEYPGNKNKLNIRSL